MRKVAEASNFLFTRWTPETRFHPTTPPSSLCRWTDTLAALTPLSVCPQMRTLKLDSNSLAYLSATYFRCARSAGQQPPCVPECNVVQARSLRASHPRLLSLRSCDLLDAPSISVRPWTASLHACPTSRRSTLATTRLMRCKPPHWLLPSRAADSCRYAIALLGQTTLATLVSLRCSRRSHALCDSCTFMGEKGRQVVRLCDYPPHLDCPFPPSAARRLPTTA